MLFFVIASFSAHKVTAFFETMQVFSCFFSFYFFFSLHFLRIFFPFSVLVNYRVNYKSGYGKVGQKSGRFWGNHTIITQ